MLPRQVMVMVSKIAMGSGVVVRRGRIDVHVMCLLIRGSGRLDTKTSPTARHHYLLCRF